MDDYLTAFVRSNPVVSDPRVDKETQSLIDHGFKVIVLGWDREGKFADCKFSGNKQIHRFKLKAPYKKPVLVFYYPIFWLWALLKLLRYRPEVVHVCDLDSSPPGLFYRFLINQSKMILDVFDTYTLLVAQKSELISKFIQPFERYVASLSDAFITVAKNRLDFFKGINLKIIGIVMNCPSTCPLSIKTHTSTCKNGNFRIIYAGAVAEHRGLLEVAESIVGLNNVEFLVAGRILDRNIAKQLQSYENVRYLGQLDFARSLKLQGEADVIPIFYDLNMPINRIASPNKLFEAMMLGIPFMTNLPCSITGIPFGLTVKYHDITGIRQAIVYLKESPEERDRLALKGRLSFETDYNWSIMEKELISVYKKIINNRNS